MSPSLCVCVRVLWWIHVFVRYVNNFVFVICVDNFLMFGLTNKCLPGAPMWTVDRSVRYHSNDGGVFNGDLGIHTYHSYNEGTSHIFLFLSVSGSTDAVQTLIAIKEENKLFSFDSLWYVSKNKIPYFHFCYHCWNMLVANAEYTWWKEHNKRR